MVPINDAWPHIDEVEVAYMWEVTGEASVQGDELQEEGRRAWYVARSGGPDQRRLDVRSSRSIGRDPEQRPTQDTRVGKEAGAVRRVHAT